MKTRQLMMILATFGAAYAALALRSDPVSVAHAETSGTRLKAKVTTGADGSKLFESEILHDATLDVDCTFHKSSDGVQRCLPTVGPNAFNDAGLMLFVDPVCTKQVVYVTAAPGGCTQVVPRYVNDYLPNPVCGSAPGELGIRVYQVYGPAAPVTNQYRKNAQNECVSVNLAIEGIPYDISPELPPNTFVAGTAGVD